ncbi:MAG: phage portal protein [Clostridiales bacterium]|nr:phage portal protein [Clostridiales bacterium]
MWLMQEMMQKELGGLYGGQVLREMGQIIRLYDYYEGKGQGWPVAEGLDYIPTRKKTNLVKKLIKAEARFMFGRTPEIRLQPLGIQQEELVRRQQRFLDRVLEQNRFGDKLIKAARDCFIGKRVALKVWADPKEGVSIQFRPSTEFVFEPMEEDADVLKKVIFFYQCNDADSRSKQRLWKQRFEMVDGRCILSEGIYDGEGRLVEDRHRDIDTGLSFIPVTVIINDGLTGDLSGESDVQELMDNQDAYNRLTSDDIDALRFNMFPQRVATDAAASSLEQMVVAPGALVDLQTDPAAQGGKASIDTLEAKFSYDGRFEHTIQRIRSDMFAMLSVPELSMEQLQGVVSSGKGIKALYWELISRCEEKWSVWEPALQWMARAILDIACATGMLGMGSESCKVYIEHLFPLFEDEETERLNDLKEVEAGVRSRSSYVEKWKIASCGTDELERIARETGGDAT